LNLVLFVFSARVERGLECKEELGAWEERIWAPRAEGSPATVDVGLRRDWDRVRVVFVVVVNAEGILFPRPMAAVGRPLVLTVLFPVVVSEMLSSWDSICMSSAPNCIAKSARPGTFGLNIVTGRCFIELGPVTRGRAAFSNACLCVAATNVPGWRRRLCRLDRFRVSPGEVERIGIFAVDSTESVMMDLERDFAFQRQMQLHLGIKTQFKSICTLNSAQIRC
jgi:hypothetical protein